MKVCVLKPMKEITTLDEPLIFPCSLDVSRSSVPSNHKLAFGLPVSVILTTAGSSFERQLHDDVHLLLHYAKDLAIELSKMGYDAKWVTTGGRAWKLRHTFVLIRHGTDHFVVDPFFKDQFFLSFASDTYSKMWVSLPAVAIGKKEVVAECARYLAICGELEFEAREKSLPPWRDPKRVASRWH